MGELGLEHLAKEVSFEEDQLLHGIVDDFFGDTRYLAAMSVDPPFKSDPSTTMDTYSLLCGWINMKHHLITNLFEHLAENKYTVLRVIKKPGCNYAHLILIPKPKSE